MAIGRQRKTRSRCLTGVGVGWNIISYLVADIPIYRHLQKLKSDPAVKFAQTVENQQVTKTTGRFMEHDIGTNCDRR